MDLHYYQREPALRDYFIQEQKAAYLLQQEIYCQGVRDGAGLLRTLGLL